jgi:phospholipase A1/A2
MKKYLLLFLSTLSFSDEINKLYLEAQNLENQGNYKEAMLLYKKAANVNISKDESSETNKEENFTNLKKAFYETQINKVEDSETNENIKQSITGNFELYPYKKNYLLPVTYDFNKSEDRQPFETVYQISIEKPISYNYFGLNEFISAAYTQKSFWQTAKHSFPFRETNYEPELFIQIPYENSSVFKSYKIGFNHNSNGKGDDLSRSWNRLYLESTFQLSELFVVPKVWYRIPEEKDDNNPNIENYYGYGDLTFIYTYQKNQFELALRNNLEFNDKNRGSAEFNWTFPLPRLFYSTNTYGMFQLFTGYGNSLIDYDRETNRVGLGIALSR